MLTVFYFHFQVSGVDLKVIDGFLVLFGLEMAEVTKLLYIVVVEDDEEERREKGKESFRYTRPVLQSTLQLMGCKARHAFKVPITQFCVSLRFLCCFM